jgi:hypothetical protein
MQFLPAKTLRARVQPSRQEFVKSRENSCSNIQLQPGIIENDPCIFSKNAQLLF